MTAQTPFPPVAEPPVRPVPLRLGLAVLATATTSWVLFRLGDGDLGVPLSSPDDLLVWVDTTPPVTLAMAVLRLVALTLGTYLTIALVVLGRSAVAHRARTSRQARLLPAFLQQLLVGGVSIGLAGTTLPLATPTAALASAAQSAEDGVLGRGADGTETAVMVKLGDEEPATTTESAPSTSPPSDASAAADEATVPPAEPAPTTTVAGEQPSTDTTPEPSDPGSSAPPPSEAPGDGLQRGDTWIVEPGDSFWSIAEEVVADRSSGDARRSTGPSDEAVSRYWADLIAANRDQLADPEDPDLLFSGQHLHLPPAI